MTQTEDREARALEAAMDKIPLDSFGLDELRVAIAAYNVVMAEEPQSPRSPPGLLTGKDYLHHDLPLRAVKEEPQPETTLDILLGRVEFGDLYDAEEARVAIHALLQEARNGK